MPKGCRPVSVNSYLGFFWPFGISFHSKIASAGTITRPLRKASFQNFELSMPSDRALKRRTVWQLESPAHEFELAFAVLIDGDDRLDGARRDVVLGAKIEFFEASR